MALTRVNDTKSLTDEDGTLKCNLYNDSGALLVVKGSKYNERLEKMYVYVMDYDVTKTAAEIIDTKKNEIEQKHIGAATVELYQEVYDIFRETLIKDSLSPKSFLNIESAIEEVIKCKEVGPVKLRACIQTVRDRDHYTLHHSMSVMLLIYQLLDDIQKYSIWSEDLKEFFKDIVLTAEYQRKYLAGALLHDYGKAWIPRSILQKKDDLSDGEYNIVKEHPKKGVWELKLIGIRDEEILRLVGNHHCHYMTYLPNQRPLELALNVLDVYDACRSDRPYKDAMNLKKTINIIDIHRRMVDWPRFLIDFLYKTTIHTSETAIGMAEKE